jgi:hypothetical protein
LTDASSELLGKYFWNNKKVTWVGTTNTFIYSSDEIRAKVPVSWGGTASDDITEASIDEKLENKVSQNPFV